MFICAALAEFFDIHHKHINLFVIASWIVTALGMAAIIYSIWV